MRGLLAAALLVLASVAGPVQAQGPLLPDLVVRGPGLIPPAPREGDGVTFNATVANQGMGSAAGARVLFLLDGEVLESFGPLLLLPGASLNLSTTAPWTATAGNHTFLAIADPTNEVPESNEGNNQAGLGLAVAPRPDLRVAHLVLQPSQPREGDEVTLKASVENAGAGDAGPFHVRVTLDGAELLNASLPGLEAGAKLDVSAPWTATSGPHLASATADWLDEVDEANEDNNARSLAFTVPLPEPKADLTVVDVRWSPSQPQHGQEVSFQALVRNVGDAGAPATLTRFTLDQALLGDVATAPLGPGEEVLVEAPAWSALAGNHTIQAMADAGQAVEEQNEANNTRAEVVSVAPAPGLPDLVVERLSWEPAQPEEGQQVVFTARVRNGGASAAGPFTVSFRVDGASLGSTPVGGLAGGAFADVRSPPWQAQAGSHAVKAVADAGQQVAESSEGNNDASAGFSVKAAQPDLVLEQLRAEPAEPSPGQQVTFEAVVRNAGSAAAGGFRVVFRVDGREVGDVRVPGLAAGASRTVASPPWQAVQGARLARAIADAGDEVQESREDNNERTLPLPSLGRLSNLVVEELRVQPQEPGPGDLAGLVAVVANLGSEASVASDLAFRLDGKLLGSPSLPALAPGARATIASPGFRAAQGAHAARAFADASQRVAELSEEDNERVLDFEVSAAIEPTAVGLALGALRLSPEEPRLGEVVRASVEVRNAGSGEAGGLVVRLLVDGAEVARAGVGPLAPGASATATLAWTAAEGDHVLAAELLQEGTILASTPPRELSVASSGPVEPTPFPGGLVLLLLLGAAALGLGAWALRRPSR